MAVPIVTSAEATYATKVNIKFPGTQAQATSAETTAAAEVLARMPSGVGFTVAGGTIKLAT